jgi:antirestriction protein ArdC
MAQATHAYHKRDLYSDVTARILTELETGAAPWIKPWSATPGLNHHAGQFGTFATISALRSYAKNDAQRPLLKVKADSHVGVR